MYRRATALDARWWREDGAVHESVCTVVRQLRGDQSGRLDGLLRAARLFGNAPLLGLTPGSFAQTTVASFGRLSLNIVRAIATTARADLVSGPPPRPMFVTSGGDYSVQRRAKGLTKFTAGVFYQTGFDATARAAALHSAVFGDGIVKVLERHGRPCIERVFPWELLVDDADGYAGDPRTMYQVRWVDRAVLSDLFPGKREAVEDARSSDPETGVAIGRDALSDQVLVVEGWHLPSGPEAGDGRHVIVVEGATLLDEEWQDESFPFVRFSWSEPLVGYWAAGLGEELAGIQLEINLTIERIRQALALAAVPRVYVERGSKVASAPMSNDVGGIYYYTGRPPIIEAARPVSPDLVAHLDRLWQRAFQLTGVSEVGAAAMKPAGLQSGKALRVYADLQSQRFAAWGRAYQDFYLAVTVEVVRLMRRLAKQNPELQVIYHDPKRREVEPIRWADVELDEEAYVLQAFPVSALPSSPAGRLAALEEMVNGGLISPETFKRLADFPDLEAENALESAPRDLLEQAMERMLHGTSEDPTEDYFPPEEFYPFDLCMRVGVLHYQRARLQRVPEERLELVRQFLSETEALIERAKAKQAPPEPPPPGPEGPPPPEAMPPGPPPEMAPPMAA